MVKTNQNEHSQGANLACEIIKKKRGKGLVMFGALLLALAITGGMFAFTWTTSSATLTTGAASNDFASISANSTGIANITWTPFGRYRGAIPGDTLFDVTPTTGYDGDLEVTVYLANPDELSKNYRFWLVRLQLQDSGGDPVDAQEDTQVLSMDNGQATFYWPSSNYTAGTQYQIECEGGAYVALPWVGAGWADTYDPLLFAQVTQAGIKTTP
ncbi:hypothetical protein ACFLWW_01525 [Chloroflexota bacterium]